MADTPPLRTRARVAAANGGGAVVAPATLVKPAVRTRTGTAAVASPPARVRPVSALSNPESEVSKAMAAITKVHGPAVIRRADILPEFIHIPTGIFAVDMAMLGGMPQGAVTLGKGWEHSGKTTAGLRTLANAQKKFPDMTAMLVDVEGTYDPAWGAVHGIDNSALALCQPGSGEEALDVTIAMMRAQEMSMIMIDSLAGLIPMSVKDKSFEDAVVGKQALMISRFCSVMQSELIAERRRAHRICMYLVNQFRYKIGVMKGDPKTTPGGVAANYVASIAIEWKNWEQQDATAEDKKIHEVGSASDKMIDHNDHSFTIKKNKLGNGPRNGEFAMVRNPDHPLGQGFIDDARTVVTWAKAHDAVTGGGSSWRVRNVDQKFSRLQEIADYMYANPEFFEAFKRELIEDFRESQGKVRNFL